METFMKADIFFFVTTVAIGVLAVGAGIIIFYIVKILKDVKHISETVLRESDKVAEDIDAVRAAVKERGNRVGTVLGAIVRTWRRRRARRREDITN